MRRLLAALVIILTTAACTSAPEPNSENSSIDAGAIALKSMSQVETGERIIALANGSAEILYALGAGSSLVGRDIASTFSGDKSVPIVTTAHSISAEKVIAQKPTLVIIDDRSGPAEAVAQIKSAGIRVASVPDAWTLSDMPKKISAIAALVGLDQRAAKLNQQQAQALRTLNQSAQGVRVAFLYLRGTASVYLLGGKGSGADALLEGIGAIDVGAERGFRAFTPLTSEALIATRPQLFLLMTKGLESVGGVEGLVKLPGIAQTDAGKNRRVVTVDDSLLLSFGPRTPALMTLLGEKIAAEMNKK